MQQKKIYTMVGTLLIILFLAACSPPAISPTEPQTTETAQLPATETVTAPTATLAGTTAIAEQGMCTNAFYPVRGGATWSYKSTGGPAGEYSFTDTITSVRDAL